MKKYSGPGCITTEFLDRGQLDDAFTEVLRCPVSPYTMAFFRYFVHKELSNHTKGFHYALKEAVSRL